MSQSDIMLLTDPDTRGRAPLPPSAGTVNVQSDPYVALEQLAQRSYRVVLVSAPRRGLDDLLLAVRRLQPAARLFGLCGPAGEHQFRRLADSLVDDYFIVPPTPRDWGRIARAAEAGPAGTDHPAARTSIPVRQLNRLIESAVSVERLAEAVGEMVHAVCETPVAWSRLGETRAGIQQLLLLDDDPPRVLFAAEPIEPDEHQLAFLSALRGLLPSLAASARRMRSLQRLATTDSLTGAYNRRYFMHFARKLLERASKERFRVTLLLYDIDDFKTYNDQFGHAVGDKILVETASLIRTLTRSHDVVARVGGDEFAVLIWDAGRRRQPDSEPPRTAADVADRFRRAVATMEFEALGPHARGRLSISGGLAAFPWDGWSVEQLLARADEALLQAKGAGKNQIYIVGQDNGGEA